MDAASQIGAAVEPLMATVKQEKQAMQPAVDKFNQVADAPLPKAPTLEKSPEAPQSGDFGAEAKEYVTAMSVLSTLAGAFSRQHGTVALGAFASGMKGYQQGNKEALDQAHKEWKDATDKAITNNKFLTDQYKEIIENRKLTEQEQMEKVKILATQYGDTITAQQSSVAAVEKLIDLQEKAKDRAAAAALALQNRKAMMDYARELKQTPNLTPEAVEQIVDTIGGPGGTGKLPPGLGIGMTGDKKAVLDRLAEKYPNVKLADMAAKYSGELQEDRTVGANAGRIKLAANSLSRMIPIAKESMKKVDLSQFPDLNKLENAVITKTGGPEVTNLNTNLQAIVADYAALMVRGGQPTVESRNAAREMVNAAMSKGQLEGFFDQVEKEKQSQLAAIEDTKGNAPQGQIDQPSSSNIVHWDDLK